MALGARRVRRNGNGVAGQGLGDVLGRQSRQSAQRLGGFGDAGGGSFELGGGRGAGFAGIGGAGFGRASGEIGFRLRGVSRAERVVGSAAPLLGRGRLIDQPS